jgi:hypothetical protein
MNITVNSNEYDTIEEFRSVSKKVLRFCKWNDLNVNIPLKTDACLYVMFNSILSEKLYNELKILLIN